MENNKRFLISDVDSTLVNKYKAIEIDGYELLNSIICCEEEIKDIIKTYKIEDKNTINSLLSEKEKEELKITVEHLEKNQKDNNESIMFDDMQKIITGKLIVLMLESEDNIHLSGFVMHGSGEKLYNLLADMIGEDLEKNKNDLDETIRELSNFRPYGKYFK